MQTAIPVAFIGLNHAGKTALVHSALNMQSETFPTAGLEINYISSTSRTILAYDCSGQGSARSNWSLLAGIADSFVYVIDGSNPGMFPWAKKYLFAFLQHHKEMRYCTCIFRKKALCVMLNKCDLKNRPPKELMVKGLEPQRLNKLVGKCYFKETSAFNKEGIDECLQWLIKNAGMSEDAK